MTISAQASRVLMGLVVLVAGSRSIADDQPGVEAKTAFDHLKTLSGEWKSVEVNGGHGDHMNQKIAYKLTAAGSVLMETFSPGSDHEMVSMYHVDRDQLLMTHYCAAKNQPRMKLDRQASTADKLVFAFDGGTGFDVDKDIHIHSGWIAFLEGGRVESEWQAYKGGKKWMATKFVMTRP